MFLLNFDIAIVVDFFHKDWFCRSTTTGKKVLAPTLFCDTRYENLEACDRAGMDMVVYDQLSYHLRNHNLGFSYIRIWLNGSTDS